MTFTCSLAFSFSTSFTVFDIDTTCSDYILGRFCVAQQYWGAGGLA